MPPQQLTNTAATSHGGGEYRVLRESAGYLKRGAGFLELRGGEPIEFLHRLSTNELRDLAVWKTRPTVLTTEKGRIVDLIRVLRLPDRVLLMTGEGTGDRVRSWLNKFIIMEDITVVDVSSDYTRLSIIGPEAASILRKLLGASPPESGDIIAPLKESRDLILLRNSEWPLPAYEVIGRPDPVSAILAVLEGISPETAGIRSVSQESLDLLRIETGMPAIGTELTEEVNPLEAGLGTYVSFMKGCYIGQEVIARLDTYKKLQRTLKGFIFPHGTGSHMPGRLQLNGSDVGWTTSHAYSPLIQREIALGYLKIIPDLAVVDFAAREGTSVLQVEVSDLPFTGSMTKAPALGEQG